MEAGDVSRGSAFVAILALLGAAFTGVVLKASVSGFFWNSAAQSMGFWRWIRSYMLDEVALLLLSLFVAYAMLRYLGRRREDGR
ncbi:hypothetical protein [Candidatus Pyrohabitans sp.]